MREEWNREEDLLFMFDAFCRKVIKFTGCAKRRDEKRKEDKMLDCIAFDETMLNTLVKKTSCKIIFCN